jgi:hypothetical protein
MNETQNIIPTPSPIPEPSGLPAQAGSLPERHCLPRWIISLVLFILFALISIYLYQQNLGLKSQLATNLPSPLPSAIPQTPTPLPFVPGTLTKDLKTNLTTYISVEKGIEFKYPSNYKLEESQNYVSIISPLLPPTKAYELRDGELKMEIYLNPMQGEDSLDKYISDMSGNIEEGNINERIKVSGKDVAHIVYSTMGSGENYYLLNHNYRVSIAKYPAKTSRQPEFNQILSSFKFTN